MGEITRRDTLKALTSATVAGLSWTSADAREARRRTVQARTASGDAAPQAGYAPRFFTPHELATVTALADMILPADERSGGASEAGVPEFMDFMMIDQPARQVAMRGGLAWLDHEHLRRFDRAFLDCTDDERRQVLDDIAWPERADPAPRHGAEFFSRFRDLTAIGFWTSRIGIDDLDYQGNVPLTEWTGCPEAALRKLGVRYLD